MKKFNQILSEAKEGKNVHLEHIEDMVFNEGVTGTRNAILFLRNLRNMLSGSSAGSVNITTKWDGAPAIFAGVDPADDVFFVAKKKQQPLLLYYHRQVRFFRNYLLPH